MRRYKLSSLPLQISFLAFATWISLSSCAGVTPQPTPIPTQSTVQRIPSTGITTVPNVTCDQAVLLISQNEVKIVTISNYLSLGTPIPSGFLLTLRSGQQRNIGNEDVHCDAKLNEAVRHINVTLSKTQQVIVKNVNEP